MIKRFINITKNHYTAALEHIKINKLNHKPTLFEALRITIYDSIFHYTMYDKETTSYLVYEVIKVPTLGIRLANVIRLYVPKEHRGNGIISKLLDEIDEKTIISGKGNYGEVGRLYLSRANF